MKTTNKLLSLTTFVAGAMSFAVPAWADDYTQTGDSTIGTDVLCYFDDADDDASAMKLGEKMLDEDALAFAFYASHATSSDSNGLATNSILASFGTEILARVETTQSTSTTLNGTLTLAPATNTSETVTVRQSAVATTSLSFDDSTEQYAVELQSLDKGRDGVGTLISPDDSGVSKETVSFLGNFDSVGYTDGSYGISTLSVGSVTLATDQTWTGSSGTSVGSETYYYWSDSGNWSSEWTDGDNATFDASGSSYTTVTVDTTISAAKITVTGGTEYIFEYAEGGSLKTSSTVTIGNSNGSGKLTISGGENIFNNYMYVGYSGTGTLEISGGENIFNNYMYVGYSGTGTLEISNGYNTFSGNYVYVGYSGGTGTLKISNGYNTFSGSYMYVGYNSDNSTGTLTIDGGENIFKCKVYVGDSVGATGSLTITGGTNTFSGSVQVDSKYTSTLTIYDGNNTFSGSYMYVGYSTAGTLEISGGENIFNCKVEVGYNNYNSTYESAIKISGGKTTFSNYVYVSYNNSTNGKIEITGGETTFDSIVYVGAYNGSGTGTLTIADETEGGTKTTFSGNSVYIGYGARSTGSLTISGGENTFSCDCVYIGYGNNSTGSLTISGGTNKFLGAVDLGYGSGDSDNKKIEITGGTTEFLGNINIGRSSSYGGTMTITGGTTTIKGSTTFNNSSCSLTIGGGESTATVYLEQQIGTTTTGSVTISDNANIILSGALLDSIAALLNSNEGGSVVVIEASSITINGTILSTEGSDALAAIIGSSISADGYDLTWNYGNGTLSVTSAVVATPEPSMFGMLFGLGALGLVSTRRRRRKA